MKNLLQSLCAAVLSFWAEHGYVKLEHYFLDGNKIEANANRYTFVWGKAVVKQQARLQEKIHILFEQIEELERKKDREHRTLDLAELGEQGQVTSKQLNAVVKKTGIPTGKRTEKQTVETSRSSNS